MAVRESHHCQSIHWLGERRGDRTKSLVTVGCEKLVEMMHFEQGFSAHKLPCEGEAPNVRAGRPNASGRG